MNRRTFILQSSLTAFSISAFGSIRWDGKTFTGDSPTTTDILGPFYRPGAPIRSNIIPPGSQGVPLHLKGVVYRENGKTPLDDALIEIWQCDTEQEYDNYSDDYLFRGALKTDKAGKYFFTTILPAQYKANPKDESSWRPAHIHMRISSPSQQDLITQIYFKGDKYLDVDESSASPESANRILELRTNEKNEQEVVFDVIMKKTFSLDDLAFKKIEGLYQTDQRIMNSENIIEFVRDDDTLFMKLKGQIVEGLNYKGDNTFEGGMDYIKVKFNVKEAGKATASIKIGGREFEAVKFLKY
jgi:catechol 1,2-dioxygenase